MKKIVIFFSVICAVLCIFLASCDDPETAAAIADGIGAETDGWSYIGTASSISECKEMAGNRGYSLYRFNTEHGTCYGR